ncbi:MAG TPA: 4Fe-4S ferredoxin [Deltaproteobacteria bacterium]|nr:4Fe-4S ferredoxin [Deltaproteobacteria bacterium]
MKQIRKIIEIDEERCTGCGQCILACAEGALELVNGKARIKGEILCDGIGACIGTCPEGALTIIEREAEEFSEAAVHAHIESRHTAHKPHLHAHEPAPILACGCSSSAAMFLKETCPGEETREITTESTPSELTHWPVKLQLLSPNANYLKNSDLLLLADCVAVASANLHADFLRGRTVAIGCPKLDNLEAHITRLADILSTARPRSLTVVRMEVPCCSAFVHGALDALHRSGVTVPLSEIVISRHGEVIQQRSLDDVCAARAYG